MPLFLPAELTFTCYITYIAFSSDMSICRIISSFFLPFMINRLRLWCVSCLRNGMKSQGKNTEIYQRQKACAEPKCKHFSYLFSSQEYPCRRRCSQSKGLPHCPVRLHGRPMSVHSFTSVDDWRLHGRREFNLVAFSLASKDINCQIIYRGAGTRGLFLHFLIEKAALLPGS
jgi:hypothetical protein